MDGVIMRPYQADRVTGATDMLLSGQHAAIVMATGTGKTITGLSVVDNMLRRRSRAGTALWLVDRRPLVRQTERAAAKFGVPVHVRTIQGLKSLKPADYDLLVIDEAHKFLTPKRIETITGAGTPMLALTATPRRGDGLHIREVFGEGYVCGPYTLGAAISEGYLCDCLVKRVELRELDLRDVKVGRNDFDQAQLASVMNAPSVNAEVVGRLLQHARTDDGALMLSNLFAVDTAHADALSAELRRQAGDNCCVTIHSKVADHDDALASFEAGERRIAVSVMMIAEGFDMPALRLGVLARPTRSERLLVQMLGRFLRPHPTKPHAILLDCDGAYETLDLARIYDVVEQPDSDEPAVTEGDGGEGDGDGIPMLSDIVSRIRVIDLLRRASAEARTLPWKFTDDRYVLQTGPREWVLVGTSRHEAGKAAAAVFFYASGYARCDVITLAADEPVAFAQAEAWVRNFRHADRIVDASARDLRDGVRRWLKDRQPPSEACTAKLESVGLACPSQHGMAVRVLRRLYARGDLQRDAAPQHDSAMPDTGG